jgi:hypothetical protein
MRVRVPILLGAALATASAIPALAGASHASGSGTTQCVNATTGQDYGTVTWSPATLWPPNHKMVTVTMAYAEASNDGDSATITVDAITDNQLVNGAEEVGSGNPHLVDWSGIGNHGAAADPNPAVTTAQVRAERSGTDRAGRTYTITLSCGGSGDGDSGTATVTVFVPHDQGQG